MRTTFDRELTDLHGRLIALGRTVRAQLDDALVALANRDADAAERIIHRHRQVGQASAEIEWRLLCILARQAPVARDLRLVAGLLHVKEHLERMAGLCANVAKAVPGLANRPPPTEVLVTLNEMGARVRQVVTASLACLADGDAAAAERLPAIDQAVDRLNDRVFAQIKKSNDPTALGWAPQLVLLARFLERLGDQAVDVGEQVRFIVTGEVRELLPSKAARIPADTGRS
ncbi:MAG TPA: phosphate signaling complex protein PhoU [Actinomycetota bacterium]|jgi:phosphate transport system protein|nr:phosphate signaling complex protein PhoU [Actinomycetota bacterium]